MTSCLSLSDRMRLISQIGTLALSLGLSTANAADWFELGKQDSASRDILVDRSSISINGRLVRLWVLFRAPASNCIPVANSDKCLRPLDAPANIRARFVLDCGARLYAQASRQEDSIEAQLNHRNFELPPAQWKFVEIEPETVAEALHDRVCKMVKKVPNVKKPEPAKKTM